MDKKVCPECATENEEQYSYCKNCGVPLNSQKEQETYSSNTAYVNQANDFYSSDSYINGIPEIEYQLYIGKNHEKFIPQFKKMEFTGSKYSWCWVPAILGFLGGPLCAALWFFYRKIYKPAWLLVLIGAVLSVITGILSMNTTDAYYDALVNSFASGNFEAFLNTLSSSSDTLTIMISSTITDIASFATALFAGLFSHNIYKNHIRNKIMEYKTIHSDPQHYRIGLTYIGGTSGGMLTVGFILMFGIDAIVSLITTTLAIIF